MAQLLPRPPRSPRAGQTCTIYDMTGLHLRDRDRVALMDTCAAATASRWSTFSELSTPAGQSGAAVRWDAARLTLPSGAYRMCWCAVGFGCSTHDALRVGAARAQWGSPRSTVLACLRSRLCFGSSSPAPPGQAGSEWVKSGCCTSS